MWCSITSPSASWGRHRRCDHHPRRVEGRLVHDEGKTFALSMDDGRHGGLTGRRSRGRWMRDPTLGVLERDGVAPAVDGSLTRSLLQRSHSGVLLRFVRAPGSPQSAHGGQLVSDTARPPHGCSLAATPPCGRRSPEGGEPHRGCGSVRRPRTRRHRRGSGSCPCRRRVRGFA